MPSESALALAENTRRLMEERNWSQRDLAARAGVSQRGIGFLLAYRNDNDRHAGLDTVDAVARAFGISAGELLLPGGKSPTESKKTIGGVNPQRRRIEAT
jgi:transcriptional regulator with XRE-family HTH domain